MASETRRPGVFDDGAREKFLSALAEGYSVTTSAGKAGVSRQTAYRHRERDEEFRRRWDDSWEQGADYLEDLMLEKAKTLGGFMANVALLRARRPLQWRENSKVELTAKVDHGNRCDLRKLSDADLLEYERLLLKAAPDGEPDSGG